MNFRVYWPAPPPSAVERYQLALSENEGGGILLVHNVRTVWHQISEDTSFHSHNCTLLISTTTHVTVSF